MIDTILSESQKIYDYAKQKTPAGFERLWHNDTLTYPSGTGYYDIPTKWVKTALSAYEEDEEGMLYRNFERL
jgi:hypothetical protein